jgi:chorismate synthase
LKPIAKDRKNKLNDLASNAFGNIFKVTSFGESHGVAIGVVIDGCPAGLLIDQSFLEKEMAHRKPGQSSISTQRKEHDEVEIVSGVFENTTTGHPILLLIRNEDQKPEDYDTLKDVFRPSHADFTYQNKYGIRDHRGGGRSSARITAGWVAAGAIAKMLLKKTGMEIRAYVRQIHTISVSKPYSVLDLDAVESNPTRCPDAETALLMQSAIEKAQDDGDSLGGIVACVIRNCPAGLGEPVFEKLNSRLAAAMFSINAVKGFQLGDGFESVLKKGSELNDAFITEGDKIRTSSNHSGGIQGGISNGMDIYFEVAFKPTATIKKEQNTVTVSGDETTLSASGRHDPCVVPRAVPIVEAMAALVLADAWLLGKLSRV